MRTTLFALITLLLVACTPRVAQVDAFYECDDGRTCPSSAPYCWTSDHFCHFSEETTTTTDGGSPPNRYAACPANRVCGAGLTCIAGVCSPRCDEDSTCPEPLTGDAICVSGNCHLSCVDASTCNGNPCAPGAWDGATVSRVCIDEARLLGSVEGMACGSGGVCSSPLTCIRGACMRPCDVVGSDCGARAVCVEDQDDFVCLRDCNGGPCVPTMTCEPSGPARRCRPTVW